MSYCPDFTCYQFQPCPQHDQGTGSGTSEAEFRRSFQGLLLKRDEPDDTGIRKPKFNLSRDANPLWWAVVKNEADIQLTVRYARANNLKVAVVTAGQHSWHSQTDNVMIDLRNFKGVTVDEAKQEVTFKMGHVLGEIDKITHQHGNLHVPMGVVSHTGAGLVLGGGVGWMCRKYGPTADHIIAGKVVLATGELVEASEAKNADLLLSLKGGGGFTGIVTEITAKAYAVPHAWARVRLLSIEQMLAQYGKLKAFLGSAAVDQERRSTNYMAFTFGPDGKKVGVLLNTFLGPEEEAKAFYAPFELEVLAVAFEGPIPFDALQGMNDAGFGPAVWYSSGYYMTQDFPPEDLFKQAAEAWLSDTVAESGGIMLEQRGGALNNSEHKTLVPERTSRWDFVFFVGAKDPAGKEAKLAAFRKLKKQFAGFGYLRDVKLPNFEMTEAIKEPENLRELRQLKDKYDPTRMFGNVFGL